MFNPTAVPPVRFGQKGVVRRLAELLAKHAKMSKPRELRRSEKAIAALLDRMGRQGAADAFDAA